MKANAADYGQIASHVAKEYKNHVGLVGIIWIGSASFGVIDKYSDIDIRLLMQKSGKTFSMKQSRVDGIKVEVDEMDWDWVLSGEIIDSERYWIREKAVILYDPNSIVKNTFQQTNASLQRTYKTQLWAAFKEIMTDYEIEKSLKRNDKYTAMLYLNRTVDVVIRFLLLYYSQIVPPFKWRVHFLTSSKEIPAIIIEHIATMLDDSKGFDEKYATMRALQNLSKELMLKKGYNREHIAEYWRY